MLSFSGCWCGHGSLIPIKLPDYHTNEVLFRVHVWARVCSYPLPHLPNAARITSVPSWPLFQPNCAWYWRYDADLTLFSPAGRLYQVEYVMRAVGQYGCPAVGVQGEGCCVVACRKDLPVSCSGWFYTVCHFKYPSLIWSVCGEEIQQNFKMLSLRTSIFFCGYIAMFRRRNYLVLNLTRSLLPSCCCFQIVVSKCRCCPAGEAISGN